MAHREIVPHVTHDLRARPLDDHQREAIDAHLNIVFAALAVTRLIEARTGWSIKKFVQTARRYRTVQIRACNQLSPPSIRSPQSYARPSLRSPDRRCALI